ncbi:hypothetical protein [Psychrobacter sp.]|uniref:hypothetical protein n=1 Tax=Psychrobacter sp. TaxID=56811 RepID=UPI003F9DB1D0
MKTTSYTILREKESTSLTVENSELLMKRMVKNYVYLTTNDDSYGVIHDKERIYAFVEIHRNDLSYSFKDMDTQLYFCSQPLSGGSDKSLFRADRVLAREWESFELKPIVVENDTVFTKALEKQKNKEEINLYWWRGDSFVNFGDELNLYIVSHLTNKRVKRVTRKETDLVGIGSILNWFPKRTEQYEVWGSGTLAPTEIDEKNYNISLLRGPLTKSLLDKEIHVPYGDPGILSSILWPSVAEKKYDWGLVVHHSQVKKLWVKKLMNNTPNSILISVKNGNMTDLMSKLSSCRNIASTSLHGLIVADSYCIPNIWLWDNNIHKGGQWKFFDYFAGINRMYVDNVNPQKIASLAEVKLQEASFKYFNQIENIQNRIIHSFPLE